MDLTLFHPDDGKTCNYKRLDRTNSRSGFFYCHLYEWIGLYNANLAERLLGHYRLFQLYKTKYLKDRTELHPAYAYILQYRENRHLKLFFGRITAFLHRIVEFGKTSRLIEIHSINRLLLYERADVLHNFLTAAEEDFGQAFLLARDQILDPQFLSSSSSEQPVQHFSLQFNEDNQYNTTFLKNEFHVHSNIKEETPHPPNPEPQPKGKEEDLFSKKQILMLFDLLARSGKLEPIDFGNPAKFENIAHLLGAITRHKEDSWIDELKKYKRKSLYAYDPALDGQRQQLIRDLINLTDKLRNAGFRNIAKLADQKIRELERAAPP